MCVVAALTSFSRRCCMILVILVAIAQFNEVVSEEKESLLIVIRSQSNEFHNRIAGETKQRLEMQAEDYQLDVKVLLMHEEWPIESSWIILPLMPSIAQKYADDFHWIMFIEENTHVDLKRLILNVLPKYSFKDEIYVGRCLVDQHITIIHHFAFHQGGLEKFHYPDFHAGWLVSQAFLKLIGENWDFAKKGTDFQIDVQHEIAMYFDNELGIKMTCSSEICGVADKEDCVTWVDYAIPDCGYNITLDHILISVKTTKMFHDSRIKVVKDTWGKFAKNILYYSNITDQAVPSIDCGVPNTNIGHCGKMEVIIKDAHSNKELSQFSWLVIADDDSIIGLAQMVKLLNCYKPNIPTVLGERYGFGLNSGRGYGYITGGGSMVMSRGAINAWIEKNCQCPAIDSPDDMILGHCFSGLVGIPVVHSPRFHQARPDDYSTGYITNLQPVSFHKHWENDPVKVYETYFAADDRAAFSTSGASSADENNTPSKSSGKDEL